MQFFRNLGKKKGLVTNVSNFSVFTLDHLDEVIFLLSILSQLKASYDNAITPYPPDRIHWCNYSINISVSKIAIAEILARKNN